MKEGQRKAILDEIESFDVPNRKPSEDGYPPGITTREYAIEKNITHSAATGRLKVLVQKNKLESREERNQRGQVVHVYYIKGEMPE